MADLPDDDLILIRARFQEGLDYREIANRYQTTEDVVIRRFNGMGRGPEQEQARNPVTGARRALIEYRRSGAGVAQELVARASELGESPERIHRLSGIPLEEVHRILGS